MTEFQAALWTILGLITIFSSIKFTFMCSDKQDKKGWRLGVVVWFVSFFITSHCFDVWHGVCKKNDNYLTFKIGDSVTIRTLSPFSKINQLKRGD
jgi:hypothetical protein